jgi:uncharacterized membrane protein
MSTPNPYAAPKAPVADASAAPRNFLPTGRALPPARGWAWIAEGFVYFRRQPGAWIAIIVIAALIFIGLGLVPILGSLAAMVLAPVFAGGLVIACREQDEGRELKIAQLFAGFSERFGTLVSIGLIYLGITVVIALVVGILTGAGMWTLLGGDADPGSVAGAGLTLVLAFLVMLAALLPVFMAVWFAPPLAVFHEQGPGEAMKSSFVACLRNILPFLVYGVILFLLAIAASIPFGLGWLVLGPVMAASLYTGYRDIFFD